MKVSSETKIALQVVLAILTLVTIGAKVYDLGFHVGEVTMLNKCRHGHPACVAPHVHPPVQKQSDDIV